MVWGRGRFRRLGARFIMEWAASLVGGGPDDPVVGRGPGRRRHLRVGGMEPRRTVPELVHGGHHRCLPRRAARWNGRRSGWADGGKGRTAAVAPGGRARGLAQDPAREGGARLRRPQPKVTDGSYPASQRGDEGSSRHVGEAGILAKRAKRARGSGSSPTRTIQAGDGWLPPVRDAEARFPSGSAACTASLAAQGVGDSAEDPGFRAWEFCTGPAVSGNLPDSEDRVREQQA